MRTDRISGHLAEGVGGCILPSADPPVHTLPLAQVHAGIHTRGREQEKRPSRRNLTKFD